MKQIWSMPTTPSGIACSARRPTKQLVSRKIINNSRRSFEWGSLVKLFGQPRLSLPGPATSETHAPRARTAK